MPTPSFQPFADLRLRLLNVTRLPGRVIDVHPEKHVDTDECSCPAARVVRAVPLPSVARRQGPTAVYPPTADVVALFDALGTAIPLDDEAEFDVFTTATAAMASYFAFARTISGWMEKNGAAPEAARAYVRQMLQGLATAGPDRSFAELAEEHQTRGGLNEQVIRAVAADGVIVPLDMALDAVLARLRAAPGR
jgi:pyrroline-5-carboxylate reductase